MTILNLKEMVKIAEKVDEIKFTGFINEKELSDVGVGFMPIEGENNFENMLDGMVLKHIDSGISVKQIVSIANEVEQREKYWAESLTNCNRDLTQRIRELEEKLDNAEKELILSKELIDIEEPVVQPKKKRGRKPKAKVEEVSKEEKEIIDFTKRYDSPKVLVPIDDEDIPF